MHSQAFAIAIIKPYKMLMLYLGFNPFSLNVAMKCCYGKNLRLKRLSSGRAYMRIGDLGERRTQLLLDLKILIKILLDSSIRNPNLTSYCTRCVYVMDKKIR